MIKLDIEQNTQRIDRHGALDFMEVNFARTDAILIRMEREWFWLSGWTCDGMVLIFCFSTKRIPKFIWWWILQRKSTPTETNCAVYKMYYSKGVQKFWAENHAVEMLK